MRTTAVCQVIQGHYGEAERMIRRSLEIGKKTLGSEHPEVAASTQILAQVLRGWIEIRAMPQAGHETRMCCDHERCAIRTRGFQTAYEVCPKNGEGFAWLQRQYVESQAGSGWGLLKTRNFGLLFSGQAVSQIGDSMNKVALLWFVYELTGSAFKMTVIGLLQTIPPLVFGPLIGVYLDRMKKKPVMIWVDFIRAGLVMLIPLLYAMEALTLERLYVLVFATSIVSTVFGPALASAVPFLVPRARLTSANALIQSTTNVGLLIGPAVSGVGIAMIGAHNVLYVDAATFLVSALCLLPIRMDETRNRPREWATEHRSFKISWSDFDLSLSSIGPCSFSCSPPLSTVWARVRSCSCCLCSRRNISMQVRSSLGGYGPRLG